MSQALTVSAYPHVNWLKRLDPGHGYDAITRPLYYETSTVCQSPAPHSLKPGRLGHSYAVLPSGRPTIQPSCADQRRSTRNDQSGSRNYADLLVGSLASYRSPLGRLSDPDLALVKP